MSSCSIGNVTVTTSKGFFTNNLSISTTYQNPTINFNNSIYNSIQINDTVLIVFEPQITTCSSTFYVVRNMPIAWNFATTTNSIRNYQATSDNTN
jgi:hypothetical protein